VAKEMVSFRVLRIGCQTLNLLQYTENIVNVDEKQLFSCPLGTCHPVPFVVDFHQICSNGALLKNLVRNHAAKR